MTLGCVALVQAAIALWYLGYPEHALQKSQEGLTLARELSHPRSLCLALRFASRLHLLRGEGAVAHERTETVIAFSMEHGIAPGVAAGMILQGVALVELGRTEAGITQIHQGLNAWRSLGAKAYLPLYLTWLADAYGDVGQAGEGLSVLAEAQSLVDTTGERDQEAEIHRLKGELILNAECGVRSAELTPETCFLKALDISRTQESKSLELRAATSLARRWQQQGKRQDAYDLLAPVYEWFTEGFDTADLQEAKGILEELS